MNKQATILQWIWNFAVVGGSFAIMFNGHWWGVFFLIALVYRDGQD